jgi:hypothetical protein
MDGETAHRTIAPLISPLMRPLSMMLPGGLSGRFVMLIVISYINPSSAMFLVA